MKMIMARLQRFGRFRQLHTIISQETIKPSSPTPPHLKTHNLSMIDHIATNVHMPCVFFYKNINDDATNILKKSLSQCLTQYYQFAGRFSTAGNIHCNDQGVEFYEAYTDTRLDDVICKKNQDQTLYDLTPNGLGCVVGKTSSNLVEVQLNRFTGGGAAVAVSISHKVADAFTMANFIIQWSMITRGGPQIKNPNPNFVSSCISDYNIKIPEYVLNSMDEVKFATRVFVFSNSKLTELKEKVSDLGMAPTNPTRVEVLTSLIFKCAVNAATTKSEKGPGNKVLKPSNLFHTVNMRNKIIKTDPEKAAGNICTLVITKTTNPREIRLDNVVAKLRNEKKKLERLRDVREVAEDLVNTMSRSDPSEELYESSSVCGFPFYEVDFGWGKPVEVTLAGPNTHKSFYMMDTPNSDGIVAIVNLPEEEMVIFQEDKELLGYVSDR